MKNMFLGAAAVLVTMSAAEAAQTSVPNTKTPLTAEAVNDVTLVQPVGSKMQGAAVLRAQILLDRAHFSPGEIDAAYGENVRKAIMAFQKSNDVNPSGKMPFTYPRFSASLYTYDHKFSEEKDINNNFEAFQPQYQFGEGLSYTTFSYSDIVINKKDGKILGVTHGK